jgi:hypothetical protein
MLNGNVNMICDEWLLYTSNKIIKRNLNNDFQQFN